MYTEYNAVPTQNVVGNHPIVDADNSHDLTTDDSAMLVMEDFRERHPATIRGNTALTEARTLMKTADVSLKLVVNQLGEFIGLISLKDIVGKKAMAMSHAMGVNLGEIQVRDIMHAGNRLPSIRLESLKDARIGDLVETFKHVNAEHFLVFEYDDEQPARTNLRGIISASVIGHRLRVRLENGANPSSFSEIVHALHGQAI